MTEKINEDLYKLCFDFIQGNITCSDFQKKYSDKFIVKQYTVDGFDVKFPMEKRIYYLKDSAYEIKNPIEVQNSDYFSSLSMILRDGFKVLIEYLKENCKQIDPQKIIDHELKHASLKPITAEILADKENDVMYLLKWMNFYKNKIINFLNMESIKDSNGIKRNLFFDAINELLLNRHAFFHQNDIVESMTLHKKTYTKKSENIVILLNSSELIFWTLCSSYRLNNLLGFCLRNIKELKKQFLAHLMNKRERKAISRMTKEEIETKKSIELGQARKNKEKYEKEIKNNDSKKIKKLEELLERKCDIISSLRSEIESIKEDRYEFNGTISAWGVIKFEDYMDESIQNDIEIMNLRETIDSNKKLLEEKNDIITSLREEIETMKEDLHELTGNFSKWSVFRWDYISYQNEIEHKELDIEFLHKDIFILKKNILRVNVEFYEKTGKFSSLLNTYFNIFSLEWEKRDENDPDIEKEIEEILNEVDKNQEIKRQEFIKKNGYDIYNPSTFTYPE